MARIKTVLCRSQAQALARYPWARYVKKVKGGYAVYEELGDLHIAPPPPSLFEEACELGRYFFLAIKAQPIHFAALLLATALMAALLGVRLW